MAFVCSRNRVAAKRFYGETLGLALTQEDAVSLVFDANGTMLRIGAMPEFTPQPFTVLGWSVADIDAEVAALTAKGVRFQIFPGLEQDAAGIWRPPGGTARVAWFQDPDGNLLSLTQF
jgi:catechol 2,3-dioxygenase-like lactoylglutathione lyase family enzyme